MKNAEYGLHEMHQIAGVVETGDKSQSDNDLGRKGYTRWKRGG